MTTYVLLLDLSEGLRILRDVSSPHLNRDSIHLDRKHESFFMFFVQTPKLYAIVAYFIWFLTLCAVSILLFYTY